MFNTALKPNTIVRMGVVVGVVEGEDIYRAGVYNVYTGNNTQRTTDFKGVSEIISEEYCDKELFAFQVYNLIK